MLFGVGIVIVALLYLLYQAAGQTLSSHSGVDPRVTAMDAGKAAHGVPPHR